jgi:TonB family protein
LIAVFPSYGARSKPGNGGGGGGIDDLLGELAGGGAAARSSGSLTRRATVELPTSKEFWSSEDNMAGRSPDEIRRVVMQHIGGLRAEYNKRLRSNPMLKGKIVVRFTIDPPGRVIRCELVNSTMNDKILEMSVVSRVQAWQFEACGRCGTATVTYPFAFSQ